jgi:hypothetical protein
MGRLVLEDAEGWQITSLVDDLFDHMRSG